MDTLVHEGDRHAVCVSFSVERDDAPKLEASHKFVRGIIFETGMFVLRIFAKCI